jgi:hypothetical protein
MITNPRFHRGCDPEVGMHATAYISRNAGRWKSGDPGQRPLPSFIKAASDKSEEAVVVPQKLDSGQQRLPRVIGDLRGMEEAVAVAPYAALLWPVFDHG